MPDLGRDKMRGDALRSLTQGGVRNRRDSFDLPVVVTHKSKMPHGSAQVLPTGKARRFQNEASQTASLLNQWIHHLGQIVEMLLGQRTFWTDMKQRVLFIECVLHNIVFPFDSPDSLWNKSAQATCTETLIMDPMLREDRAIFHLGSSSSALLWSGTMLNAR